jgi:hypothetical protein
VGVVERPVTAVCASALLVHARDGVVQTAGDASCPPGSASIQEDVASIAASGRFIDVEVLPAGAEAAAIAPDLLAIAANAFFVARGAPGNYDCDGPATPFRTGGMSGCDSRRAGAITQALVATTRSNRRSQWRTFDARPPIYHSHRPLEWYRVLLRQSR